MLRLFACDDGAPLWLEPANEAHLSFRSASLVPRQPETIRRAHLRLAHMTRNDFSRKNVSTRRLIVGRITASLVECIDHQLALDENRLLTIFIVEHNPAPKAALGLLSGLCHDRFGPSAHHSHRGALLRFVLVAERPGVIQAEHLRRLPCFCRARTASEC